MAKKLKGNEFGKALRGLRETRRLSQRDLAERVKGKDGALSPAFVALIEGGTRHPSTDKARALARALRCSPEESNRLDEARAVDILEREGAMLPAIRTVLSLVFEYPNVLKDLPSVLPTSENDGLIRLLMEPRLRSLTSTLQAWTSLHAATRLDAPQYYERLTELMNGTKPRRSTPAIVRATSVINARGWRDDPRQRAYFEANRHAIARGAEVRRLFVVDDSQDRDFAESIAREHASAGVQTKVIERAAVQYLDEMTEDWVLFETPYPVLLLDYYDPGGSAHVAMAAEIESGAIIDRYRRNHDLVFSAS